MALVPLDGNFDLNSLPCKGFRYFNAKSPRSLKQKDLRDFSHSTEPVPKALVSLVFSPLDPNSSCL